MAEVVWGGETFRTVDKVALMALMRFAKVVKAPGGSSDAEMTRLAAVYDLLQSFIDPADWQRFEDCAVTTGADEDELMQVVADTMEALQSRPTSRPSVSSDGPSTVNTSLPVDLSSAVTAREQQGRPDLAQVHVLAERSRVSA